MLLLKMILDHMISRCLIVNDIKLLLLLLRLLIVAVILDVVFIWITPHYGIISGKFVRNLLQSVVNITLLVLIPHD